MYYKARTSHFALFMPCFSIVAKLFSACILCLIFPAALLAQQKELPVNELKKLTFDELMNIEVISVSKSPEKLTEVPSAIQVITREDILRSTAVRLPDALRLAGNLQVARASAHDYAIASRGFNGAPLSNNTLANKLLVMIDGRAIYEPILGGVFWDAQNVLLEDISRIEVVSGPGGTLWGANAVNGVINVVSKRADETQGLFVSAGAGSLLKDYGALRYGGKAGKDFYYRVYAQRFDTKGTLTNTPASRQDVYHMTQAGFRMDYLPSNMELLTIQGNIYKGSEDQLTPNFLDGQNILARYSLKPSQNEGFTIQTYYDRTWRDLPIGGFNLQVNTFDFDAQHHFKIGGLNRLLYGVGYRVQEDETKASTGLTFNPLSRSMQLLNIFVQDQFSIIRDKLTLTVGTKLLHNKYTGFELQPSARIAFVPNQHNTLWAAVSRAVRTPTRFDTDVRTPALSTPSGTFRSEKLTAFEIGYRARPVEAFSFSIAGFYNIYRDLRSINLNPNPPTTFIFANDQRGRSGGIELSGNAFITKNWRLRGGYTFLKKNITAENADVIAGNDKIEALDPKYQFTLQSTLDLPANFQFDLVGKYIDNLVGRTPALSIPAYASINARLAWERKTISLALMGENITRKTHKEFASREIPRSFYTKITLRF